MRKVKRKYTLEPKNPQVYSLTLEERIKVISNLIIDRIIEDQARGKLRFRSKR